MMRPTGRVSERLFEALGLKKKLGKCRGEKKPKPGTRAHGRMALVARAQQVW